MKQDSEIPRTSGTLFNLREGLAVCIVNITGPAVVVTGPTCKMSITSHLDLWVSLTSAYGESFVCTLRASGFRANIAIPLHTHNTTVMPAAAKYARAVGFARDLMRPALTPGERETPCTLGAAARP